MTELNDVKKEEIRIKQNKLKTLIDIEKLTAVSTDSADSVNKDNILNYTKTEKHEIVLDILNDINITELDSFFIDTDTSLVNLTIESDIDYLHRKSESVPEALYSEFISVLANYDIENLLDFGILNKYLTMLKALSSSYDDICLSDCKKI